MNSIVYHKSPIFQFDYPFLMASSMSVVLQNEAINALTNLGAVILSARDEQWEQLNWRDKKFHIKRTQPSEDLLYWRLKFKAFLMLCVFLFSPHCCGIYWIKSPVNGNNTQ